MKTFFAIVLSMVLAFIFGSAVEFSTGIDSMLVASVFWVMALLTPAMSGVLMVVPTIWLKDLAENLYPDNSFFLNSRDDSMFLDGDTLKLPQAAAAPGVEVDREILPASIDRRKGTSKPYEIHEFTSNPEVLTLTDAIELSYDARASILFNHYNTLQQKIADYFGQAWGPTLATNFARTTGSSRAALESGQTGNRKAVQLEDLVELARLRDRQDFGSNGWGLFVPANLMADIRKMAAFNRADQIGADNLLKGAIGEIMGFSIFTRSYFSNYDNTATPVKKAFGASVAAADNLAIVAAHPMAIRRALGTEGNGGVKVFINEDVATMYGSVFSAQVNAGGAIARTDEKGVVALIEAHV